MMTGNETLYEIRQKLLTSLGEHKSVLYLQSLRRWARGEISIQQFHTDVGNLTNSEQLKMHHRFVREFGKKTTTSSPASTDASSEECWGYSGSPSISYPWEEYENADDEYGRLDVKAWLVKLKLCDPQAYNLISEATKVYMRNIISTIINSYRGIKPNPNREDVFKLDEKDMNGHSDNSEMSSEGSDSESSCMDYADFRSQPDYMKFNKVVKEETVKPKVKEESSSYEAHVQYVIKKEIKAEVKEEAEPVEEITLYAMKEEDDVKIEDVQVKAEIIKEAPTEKSEEELLIEEQGKLVKMLREKSHAEVIQLERWKGKITVEHVYHALKTNPECVRNNCLLWSHLTQMGIYFNDSNFLW